MYRNKVMSYMIIKKFDQVSKLADLVNAKERTKRIHTMTHSHYGKVLEVGFYDSKTKKFALTDVRAHDAIETVKEMTATLEGIAAS